jgi:hypothetical protein
LTLSVALPLFLAQVSGVPIQKQDAPPALLVWLRLIYDDGLGGNFVEVRRRLLLRVGLTA